MSTSLQSNRFQNTKSYFSNAAGYQQNHQRKQNKFSKLLTVYSRQLIRGGRQDLCVCVHVHIRAHICHIYTIYMDQDPSGTQKGSNYMCGLNLRCLTKAQVPHYSSVQSLVFEGMTDRHGAPFVLYCAILRTLRERYLVQENGSLGVLFCSSLSCLTVFLFLLAKT